MLLELVAEPACGAFQRPLERGVGERLDLAAVVAHDMVVVGTRSRRLEAGDPVADLNPLDETELDERVENPVHAGDADTPAATYQRLVKLLGAPAAIPPGELFDQRGSGAACTVAARPKRRLRRRNPGLHPSMIATLIFATLAR